MLYALEEIVPTFKLPLSAMLSNLLQTLLLITFKFQLKMRL
jgi:hypothetical protein